MDFFDIVDEHYGAEKDGLVPEDEVEVPRNTLQLSEQLSQLQQALSDSEDYGISIYNRTVQFLDNL